MASCNGGLAFPCPIDCKETEMGMSLRDWFAGQALIAVFSGAERNDGWDERTAKVNAGFAYELADAMIAEREKHLASTPSS